MDIQPQEAKAADPFASQRTEDNNPFTEEERRDDLADLGSSPPIVSGSPKQDRRMSKEWGKSSAFHSQATANT